MTTNHPGDLVKLKDYGFTNNIVSDSIGIVRSSQESAYRSINIALLWRNWILGKRICDEELAGDYSENYGKQIVKNLSKALTNEFGKGFSERNLYSFIRFYRMFPDILQTLSAKSSVLTWSHYQELMRVVDDDARLWYLEQSLMEGWSVRTLDRNIATQYYERMLLTQSPDVVRKEMVENTEGYEKTRRLEFIKNPVVAEFLGLSQNIDYSETELETAILDNMQKFLLEMGRGYAFVARQKHIRTQTSDYFIDLVFYNFDLKCFILIDLKTGKLSHQDVGQMDMYVRMYDEMYGSNGNNPTLGLILCSETDQDVVHYSILNDKDQLFTAKYLLNLPSKEQLRAEIEAQKAIYYSEHPYEGGEE